jgi:hypothetical protein
MGVKVCVMKAVRCGRLVTVIMIDHLCGRYVKSCAEGATCHGAASIPLLHWSTVQRSACQWHGHDSRQYEHDSAHVSCDRRTA